MTEMSSAGIEHILRGENAEQQWNQQVGKERWQPLLEAPRNCEATRALHDRGQEETSLQ